MTDLTVGGKSDPPMWATQDIQKRIRDLLEVQTQAQFKSEAERKEAEERARRAGMSADELAADIAKQGKQRNRIMTRWQKSLKTTLQGVVQQAIIGGASFETKIKRMLSSTAESWAETVSSWPILGPFIGGLVLAFTSLTKTVWQALEGLTQLIDTGIAGLNGDFLQLMRISGDYEIGLIDLIEVLKNHSESITRMTTDNGKVGADAFGELSFAVRKQIKHMDYFGLSISETNEMLGNYLDTQNVYGQLQRIDIQRQKIVVAEYIEQITRLSFMTGKRRKQVQAEVEEVTRKKSIAMALAGMSVEMRAQFTDFLGLATAFGDTGIAMAEDILRVGTTGLSDASAMGTVAMPQLAKDMMKMAKQIRNGQKITLDQQAALIGAGRKDAAEKIRLNSRTYAILAEHADGFEHGADLMLHANRNNEDAFKKEFKIQGSLAKLYVAWDHIQQSFKSTFMRIAVTFAQWLEDSGTLTVIFGNLKDTLETFATWMKENLSEENMNNWFDFTGDKNMFSGMINTITDMFGELFGKMFDKWDYAVDSWLGQKTMTPLGPIMGIDSSKVSEEDYLKEKNPGDYEPSMLLARKKLEQWNSKKYRDKYKGSMANVPGISTRIKRAQDSNTWTEPGKGAGNEDWVLFLKGKKQREEELLKSLLGNKEVSEFTANESKITNDLLRRVILEVKENKQGIW